MCSSRSSRRADASAPPRGAETEVDLDQVSREQLGALEAELAVHEGEPAGGDRGARDQQRGAAGRERGAASLERGAAEHERRAPERQRGALHGQRRVPAQDRRAHRAHQRHGQPPVEHRRRHDLPRRRLRIRKFTPQIAETFNLVPHDIGRSIETFAHKWITRSWSPTSSRSCRPGRRSSASCAICDHRAFFLRILPYRAKGTVAGVVLTLIDVSGAEGGGGRALPRALPAEQPAAAVPDAIYFKDAQGRFIRANDAMAARLGSQTASEAMGKTAFELPDHDGGRRHVPADEVVLRTGAGPALQPRTPRTRRREPRPGTSSPGFRCATATGASWASSASSATSPSRSAPRRRSRKACAGATSSWRCSRTSFATRSARSSRRPRFSRARPSAQRRRSPAGDRRPPVAADGAPARRSARGEPRHAEQDRAAKDRHRPARRAGRSVRGDPRRRSSSAQIQLQLDISPNPHPGRRRPGAAAADPRQPAQQRGQVHAARRTRVAQRAGRRRHGRRAGARRRRRHSARHARLGVRPLRAVEPHARPRRGRPRRRADARPLAGRDARRHRRGAQRRRGTGQRVRRAAAADPSEPGRRTTVAPVVA